MLEYEAKWEKVMSRTSVATWEACRQFLLHVKRFGFTQLRKTNEGYLYGLNEFRIEIPESLVRGVCSASLLADLVNRFDGVKSQVISVYPQYKNGKSAANAVVQEPVINPDDVIRGGTAGADSDAMNVAGVGSIPTPPSILNADARREPVTALEGSIGTISEVNITKREEQPVARHGSECSECGGPKYGRGYKHKPNCSTVRGNVSTNKPRAKREPVVVVPSERFVDYLEAFTIACDNMRSGFKALLAERDMYKRERDELAEWKNNFAAMFAVKK